MKSPSSCLKVLVLAAAVIFPTERPVVGFEHVDGGAGLPFELIFVHMHKASPARFRSR